MENSKPKVLVILGSARSESNTLRAVRNLSPFQEYEIVDLRDYRINLYDYNEAKNGSDDFILIAMKMMQADIVIFATPVYWYTMSGSMKVFFDRLTDLIGRYKPIGKSLKGKKTYLIVSGGQPQLSEGFETPFRLTSKYLNMDFVETFYEQAVKN